ncbi:predicted protein [Lichtheimia corymbifera JMRC:FSU:9682]|uniref:Uncharacterized protein n=1 Tax=Lichtheimia corymbifera JMRC:FSU:9682 TaxID=1263082 RepID=A0A068RMF0_9FUNG|nr:predicted protein [Lichtheimia corymbifera JMRC:FSU:9682]
MPTPILMWSVLRLLPQVRDKRFNPQHGILMIPRYGILQNAQLPQMGDMVDALADQCEQAKYHDDMLIHDDEETYSSDYIEFLHQFIPKIWFIVYLTPLDRGDDYTERRPVVPYNETGFPEGWLEITGDRVKVVEWALQISILEHPATGFALWLEFINGLFYHG